MKKSLLFWTAMAVASGAVADEWVKPEYNGAFQPLTAGDTVYVYNPEARLFLTEGDEWGTHASVGASGLLITVQPYVAEGSEWDQKTYNIFDLSVKKGGWYKMFITDGGNVYMDNGSQADNTWRFNDLGNNTYQFIGGDANPVWTGSGDMAGYVMGRYTAYVNASDGIESGTGVIYDYYGVDHEYAEGTFQTAWAFVSREDYAAYGLQVQTYEAAVSLGRQIAEAEATGVSGLNDEKAVYANTASTLEDLQAASASVEQKLLAYYEVSVTPETPVNILTDDCSDTDGWVNGAGAQTFKNGKLWEGAEWEGFAVGDSYLEFWDASLSGSIYREREGLPNGIYVVTISAQAEKAPGAVFANENRKAVPADKTGHIYKVTTEVTDGTLQFGYVQDDAAENWVTLDNVSVDYYGTGLEAYRFWLNSLLESAPSFDEAIVMDSLVTEYEAVLASVNTAQTKEEILDIIPAYEAILDEIDLNIAAYEKLIATGQLADEKAAADGINAYYAELLGDFTTEVLPTIVEESTLGTDAVNAASAQLQAIIDEAQQYLWDIETLENEVTKAATVYEEYKDVCLPEAEEAYQEWVGAYEEAERDAWTDADVKTQLEALYAIEFELKKPADPASDDNPVDYTAKIQYPSFDGGATGWTNDGWNTCGLNSWNDFADGTVIDQLYLNLWNGSNARVYQTLTNLPAGAYVLQASAFANADGFQVYANEDYIDVLVMPTQDFTNENGAAYIYSNISDDTEVVEGEVWRGNIYRVATVVGEDGTLEIGARNVSGGEVWAMLDNVKLIYYGAESIIATGLCDLQPTAGAEASAAIYSLAGTKLPALQKGINIVKMQDGTVRKVFVK